MENFNVGEKVVIRNDLVMGQTYVVPEMLPLKGSIATVSKVGVIERDNTAVYYLDVTGDKFFWTNDMLFPLANGVYFQTAISHLTEKDFFKGKNKNIYIRDGVIKLEGISDAVSLSETFVRYPKLTLQELLVEENVDKDFDAYIKAVTAPITVVVKKDGKGYEVLNKEGINVLEDYYLSDIAFAEFVEVTE